MKSNRLDTLIVKNFKCFENLHLHFGNLTVLSGYNCAGKSTSIQPILLLSQFINSAGGDLNKQKNCWPLNGEFVRLGTFGEVLYEDSLDSKIQFSFGLSDGSEMSFKFNSATRDTYLNCKKKIDSKKTGALDCISQLSFLSTMRGGVEEVYPKPDYDKNSRKGVGPDGKFASYVYDESVEEVDKFGASVKFWLNYLIPNASIDVQALPGVSLLALKFKLSEISDYQKPINVGYGLSYTFPIIVSLQAAKKNDLVIIDSPEAHLHPQAQSRMGNMIAQFAEKGVQIIIETHSDHILNGIRLAVLEKKLNPDDLTILFFSGAKGDNHGVISTSIDSNGNLSNWPRGFFDQIEIDTATLLGM